MQKNKRGVISGEAETEYIRDEFSNRTELVLESRDLLVLGWFPLTRSRSTRDTR